MDDQFDKMIQEFKEFGEMRAYSHAQHRTILELSNKINKLEAETKELKKQLEQSVPKDPSTSNLIIAASDEEYICRVQIVELKKISQDRELTLDEVKKFDIFTKVLGNLKGKTKEDKGQTPKIDDDALLAFFTQEVTDGNKT